MGYERADSGPSVYDLIERLRREIRRQAPGISTILNLKARKHYGVDFATLLLSSPSKAYQLVLELYGGKRGRWVAERVIARPLAFLARRNPGINAVIEMLEQGRDTDIARLLGLPSLLQRPGPEAQQPPSDGKVLAEALSCAVLVERLVARVYEDLSRCRRDAYGVAFSYIAGESYIHADVFAHIASELGVGVDEEACPAEPGGLVEQLRVLEKKLAKGCPDERELLRVLGFLASLEDHVGEEEYTRMLIPALRSIMGEKFEVYELVLESIARDEENHAAIVRRIYQELVSGRETGQSPS
ncbi:hypothetical protein [Pyrodictium abyssi]|uniref:Rubrerythrin diiron-binding domain-containing protein n=1 Tax=Pyrodictium abyssi TaxID=54256 RepID=A0ABM8IUG7_9CREN|nr:hypothetical protein PABY_07370 [Pyrodictium abyssi]